MSEKCGLCKNSLEGDTKCTINGQKVCYTCKSNQQCGRCNGFIDQSIFVNAANKVFHEDCFRCSKCSQILDRFFVDNGQVGFFKN